MSKRAASPVTSPSSVKNRTREQLYDGQGPKDLAEMGELEDLSGDPDSDSEDDVVVAGGSDGEETDHDNKDKADGGDKMDVDEPVRESQPQQRQKRENMEYDPSTYDMLHEISMEWPCLSFDILRDELGEERRSYPQTVYLVAGSQAQRAKDNRITVMKISAMRKMRHEGEDEEEEDDSDEEDEDRIIDTRTIPLTTTTNRLRVSPHSHTAASMGEDGNVYIWDLSTHYASLNTPNFPIPPAANKPISTLRMHKRTEGYAIDWSPHTKEAAGKLATGDNNGQIFISTCKDDGTWATASTPLRGHTGSIEELQWSPNQRHVFASASSDGTVKVYDARSSSKKHELSIDVSSSDVNVTSWCHTVPHLLATGADDGVWAAWDLRVFPNAAKGEHVSATASFTHHQQPITSVEFHPTEDSLVAVASADGAVTLWDLSVEHDDEESKFTGGVDVPPQLMFDHRGLEDPKEVHWHRQCPGVLIGTGSGGINVFKTFNI